MTEELPAAARLRDYEAEWSRAPGAPSFGCCGWSSSHPRCWPRMLDYVTDKFMRELSLEGERS